MAKYLMVLDQGTTSSRCILFNKQGEIKSVVQKEFLEKTPILMENVNMQLP